MASLAEPLQGGPYPHPDDDADIPNDLKSIVDWTAGRSVMRFTSTSDRDLKLPSPTEGQLCVTNVGTALQVWVYKNSAWREMWVEGSADYDTGWVDVPTLGEFTGLAPRIRRVGKVVELYSGNLTGAFPVGLTDIVAVSGIPLEFRPAAGNRWGSAYTSSSYPAGVVVRSDGSVSVVQQTGASRTSMQFSITWTV